MPWSTRYATEITFIGIKPKISELAGEHNEIWTHKYGYCAFKSMH